jgi:hypothetical protein
MTRDEWTALYDLSETQDLIAYASWLQAHKGQRYLVQALWDVWKAGKSRVEQLRKYQEKKCDPAATFRPYAPIKASAVARVELKRRAVAEGVATHAPGQEIKVCGHEGLDGRRCWLAPHTEEVAHRF